MSTIRYVAVGRSVGCPLTRCCWGSVSCQMTSTQQYSCRSANPGIRQSRVWLKHLLSRYGWHLCHPHTLDTTGWRSDFRGFWFTAPMGARL